MVEICGVEEGRGEERMGGGVEGGWEDGGVGICGWGRNAGLLFWVVVVMNVKGGLGGKEA